MWTEVTNKSGTLVGNGSKMVDPDLLTQQVLLTAPLRNGSAAAVTEPSSTEDSLASSGIIPGAVAATVFIAFLLVLYTVLWKCMVSPPKRKKRKIRVRTHQKASV